MLPTFVKKGIVFRKNVGRPHPGAFEKKALIQTAECQNMVGYVFFCEQIKEVNSLFLKKHPNNIDRFHFLISYPTMLCF